LKVMNTQSFLILWPANDVPSSQLILLLLTIPLPKESRSEVIQPL
jgi:hypothetical protein